MMGLWRREEKDLAHMAVAFSSFRLSATTERSIQTEDEVPPFVHNALSGEQPSRGIGA